jgi:exonuclease III
MSLHYSGNELRQIGSKWKRKLDLETWSNCKKLGLVEGTKRGTKGGKKKKKCDFIDNLPSHGTSSEAESSTKCKKEVFIGYLNAQSVCNKTVDIHDLVVEKDFDVLFLSETWLKECGDEFVINDVTPPGYSFEHRPRSGRSGGVVGVLFKSHLNLVVLQRQTVFKSFEYVKARLTVVNQAVEIICVYRPPPSRRNKLSNSLFHEEFSVLLDSLVSKERLLILGDINFHFDKLQDNDTKRLIETLNGRGLCQLITRPTHRLGHILDWVITRAPSESLVKSVSVEDLQISDHFVLSLSTDLSRPKRPRKTIKCRNIKAINSEHFTQDLLQSKLILDPPAGVDELAELYNQTLVELLDKHAPVKSKRYVDHSDCPCEK